MKHKWSEGDVLSIEYNWKLKGNWNSVSVKAENTLFTFGKNSEADFLTEHYWGYTRVNKTITNEYEVKHPAWKVYNVTDSNIDIDFGVNYGNDFQFLNDQKPISIMLAEGSEISVGNKRKVS